VFEGAGFDVLAAPVSDVAPGVAAPASRLRAAVSLMGELLAWIYYRLAGYL
jgi:hypothetical protein